MREFRIGDNVRVNKNEDNAKLHGCKGKIVNIIEDRIYLDTILLWFYGDDDYYFVSGELDLISDEILKVKMIDKTLYKIGGDIEKEWYDLRCSSIRYIIRVEGDCLPNYGCTPSDELTRVRYNKGDVIKIGLGIALEPPSGYEVIIAPRSSTFQNYGFLLTNGVGVCDNTYRGEYSAIVYCTRDGEINHNDRFLQMRLQKQQPSFDIEFVDELNETERGTNGYGSTGVK